EVAGAGLLDLHDLGALLAEEPGAEGCRDARAEVEDPEAREGSGHALRGVAGLLGLDRVHAAGPARLGASGGLGRVAHDLGDHEVVLQRLALAHAVDGVVDRVLDRACGDRWYE